MFFNPNMFNDRGCGCRCGDNPCNPCVIPGCHQPSCGIPNIQPTPIIMPTREQVSHRQVAHEQPIITPIDNRTITHHVFTPRFYVQPSTSAEDVVEANPFTAPQATPFAGFGTPMMQMGPMNQTQMSQMAQTANPFMNNENTNTASFTNIVNRNVF